MAYFHPESTLGWFESILITFPEELPCFSDLKSFASANDSQACEDADIWAQQQTRQSHVVLLSWNDACVKRIKSPAKWLWFTSTHNTSNSNQCPPSIARPQWAALRSDQWPGYAWLLFSLLLLKGINMMRFTLQQIFTFSSFFFM